MCSSWTPAASCPDGCAPAVLYLHVLLYCIVMKRVPRCGVLKFTEEAKKVACRIRSKTSFLPRGEQAETHVGVESNNGRHLHACNQASSSLGLHPQHSAWHAQQASTSDANISAGMLQALYYSSPMYTRLSRLLKASSGVPCRACSTLCCAWSTPWYSGYCSKTQGLHLHCTRLIWLKPGLSAHAALSGSSDTGGSTQMGVEECLRR